MTTIKKFEFKKSYETIEAAGHTFTVDMSDEAISKYSKRFLNLEKEMKKIKVDKLNQEEQLEELKNIVRDSIDLMIGGGKFDMLYQETGKSIFTMMDFAMYLAEVTTERLETFKTNDAVNKYIK